MRRRKDVVTPIIETAIVITPDTPEQVWRKHLAAEKAFDERGRGFCRCGHTEKLHPQRFIMSMHGPDVKRPEKCNECLCPQFWPTGETAEVVYSETATWLETKLAEFDQESK